VSDIKSLGYVKIQTNDIDRWRTFAFDVLGFAKGTGPDPSALYLRMDERAARIVVAPGETDEIVTVGWEVRDGPALLRVQETLQSAGVGVKQLPQEEADARRVEEAITFCDPTGTTIEVFHGAVLDHSPVIAPFGARFITGAQGLGHVVLPATDPNAAVDFYTDVLGFLSRGAWRLPAPPEFGPVRIRFLGVNERHPAIDVFSFLGPLAVKQLHDCGLAVLGSRIGLLCDNDFLAPLHTGLASLGANVKTFDSVAAVHPGAWDAFVVALQPTDAPRVGQAEAAHLAACAPDGAVVVQFWGDIDRAVLAANGLAIWPAHSVGQGHMGILLSEIGPEPIIRLQTGGLRAAEWVRRGGAVTEDGFAQLVPWPEVI